MITSQKYNAASDTELSYGNSADGYSGYDRFGRIVGTQWKAGSTVLVQSKYGRNAVGGVSWRKDEKAHAESVTTQDTHYWYDGLWQVRRADRGELTPSGGPPYTGITNLQQQENFGYDETGNWMAYQARSPALIQNRTHNRANETTTIAGPSGVAQPDYDEVGNMTAFPAPSNWTTGYTAKWDAWNRLVEIKQGTTVIGSYIYDARARRIKKTTTSETRDYYYDNQWRSIEERVSGSIKAQYVWSSFDRWNLIRRQRSVSGTLDETIYALRDQLDPVAIIDGSGSVAERYAYDAFGPARIMNPDFTTRASSSKDWTFLFHGEFIDSESGLYNYGFRYYHPLLGRWLSRDPIGYQGGINLFAFIGNDPVNDWDRYGLDGQWTEKPGSIRLTSQWTSMFTNYDLPDTGSEGFQVADHISETYMATAEVICTCDGEEKTATGVRTKTVDLGFDGYGPLKTSMDPSPINFSLPSSIASGLGKIAAQKLKKALSSSFVFPNPSQQNDISGSIKEHLPSQDDTGDGWYGGASPCN